MEKIRIRANYTFGKRFWLRKEMPVPVGMGNLTVHLREHYIGGYDVKE